MPLLVGTRLGPYEILSALGAGGMGEVYKAQDARLDRPVAIKVLPSHVAGDPERKQRFEREAKTLAALSHPHICPVFDVGTATPSPGLRPPSPPPGGGEGQGEGAIDFLVMEYLEGQTLAERLTKGALPLDQALQYAIQIADALDKAHRKGIVHRDLKPGNVMLTKQGVKLLDFGLAKLQAAGAVAGMSMAATVSSPLTGEGAILGTLHYMAPEQVEGKDADTRSDIFAFGAVVYEMATGKRAFEGKTAASVMAAILERQPPAMSSLQPLAPPLLNRVVSQCLDKDPEQRWQTARDLEVELKWIAEGGGQITSGASAPAHGVRLLERRVLLLSLGTMLLGAGLTGLAIWFLRPASSVGPEPVSRFSITLPADQQFSGVGAGTRRLVALSP